ncbi:MAG TPA: NeuD/PglB/VioB family sugar acetyltransferase [Methanocella sp.]|uniref:NeuD/PglB/VioB family sugar acetyltransferase n=1 Tax=Methanocella sp. TaxID=2052833 RepID=UPI002D1A27BB|nr:NeuD/PglB/VioB family sugar acetyltransferase [Methanocella sp.]HTY90808.1 NeuD/PglB/VioB family sugar acetyltransferase [Methanocella sp.]
MDDWVVFGFGDFFSDIADSIHASQGRIKAVVNNLRRPEEPLKGLKRRTELLGYDIPVIELDDFLPAAGEKYCLGFINRRDRLAGKLKQKYGLVFSPLIHPAAYLGSNVQYGEGVIIGPHAVLAPNCKIGNMCVINRALSIGHDTEIGPLSFIAPGVSIAGMVRIGPGTTIGIGATVIDNVRIGSNAIIGAGAVVVGDVPDNAVYAGVPARFLRNNDTPVAGVPSKSHEAVIEVNTG